MKKTGVKKAIIAGVIFIVILGLGIWGYSVLAQPADGQVTKETVGLATIVNDNRYSGVIESQSRETVTATSNQEIYSLYVEDGELVTEDTDLYETVAGETIEATVDGEVTGLDFAEDDTVMAGETIMEIVDFNNLQVAIKIDEYQLSDIAVGDPVTILIDSIDQTVEGTVSEISREAKNENGVSYFTAIIDFQGNESIRIGMNAEVVVVEAVAENVLNVPVAAIQFDGEGQSYVIREVDEQTSENCIVTTGVTDGVNIQIVEGLSEGDTILIPVVTTTDMAAFGPMQTSN
ncbi:HlyD family efflux transporter periplasmic adaptor subunit [Eubacteriaceae bacterium ES2]|nr:HlyD family efflux transporter periplasmic adaptor subunit [Eubacteriaceae bacterium ES2]